MSANAPVLLRRKQISDLFNIPRSTVWQLVKEGRFPRPIKPTARTALWLAKEVHEWARKYAAQLAESTEERGDMSFPLRRANAGSTQIGRLKTAHDFTALDQESEV